MSKIRKAKTEMGSEKRNIRKNTEKRGMKTI